jgi:carboxypeptidase family protein/TonB-dependent receptor-like protein
MSKRLARVLLGALLIHTSPLFAWVAGAQIITTGMVVGRIHDATGAVVSGVSVKIVNLQTSLSRETVSDSGGQFLIPALEPGSFRITATLPGFATAVVEPVTVTLGESVSVDVALQIASLEQSITVSAQPPRVDIRRTDPSALISREQIDSLPLNKRNFVGLSAINAGVVDDQTPQQGVQRNSGLSIHGQRARSNSILIDGLDNNGMSTGSIRGIFSQDAIQEFQVFTGAYSAEFGQVSAGTVNIITASGANRLAAQGFVYGRSDTLNAKQYFERYDSAGRRIERPKAPFSQMQWGGTLGGPIRRDRTFYFSSFERRDARLSNFITIEPTTAALLRSNGFPVDTDNVAFRDDATQLLGKITHQWRPGHDLTLRANYSDTTNENIEPWGGLIAKSAGVVDLRRDWAVAGSQTDLFSRWMTDVRAQASSQVMKNRSLDPTCGGPCIGNFVGGPTVEIVGQATAGRNRITPNPVREERIQAKASLTRLGPVHLFKAGGDVSRVLLKSSLPGHFGGRYIFTPLPAIAALGLPAPVSAVQAFGLGLPAAYIQGFGNPDYEEPFTYLSGFVQDEWQARRRLLLKFGARYQKQLLPDTVFRTNGFATPYTARSGNEFAPRLALAFDPTGNGGTVIRAAYGIFFEQNLGAILGVPSIVNGRDGVRTLVMRFPATVAAWRAPGRTLPEPPAYPSLQFAIDPGLETPFAHHLSVGVDHALGEAFALSASINGVRGKNQIGTIDYNPIIVSLGPGRRPLDIAAQAGTSTSVLQYTSFAQTWYWGLDVMLRRSFVRGHAFSVAYTLSKAEDNSPDFQSAFLSMENGQGRRSPDDTGLPVGFDPDLDRGPALGDQRHRLVATASYRLPWSLEVGGILTAASGRPYNVLAGVDLNGDGDGGTFPQDRARRDPADPTSSVRRNSERLPGTFTMDARLSRPIRLSGQSRIELMVEGFNLFNRTNFTGINNLFGPGSYPQNPLPTYGQFTTAGASREIQLALRVSY